MDLNFLHIFHHSYSLFKRLVKNILNINSLDDDIRDCELEKLIEKSQSENFYTNFKL